jgi:protein farnesyltransferase subunit beta
MTMHDGGEVDVRGCYCALCVCYMLGMDGSKIVDGCDMLDFVRRCQGYEGGIGGEPGNEGHGGYAFCAYAALVLAEEQGWFVSDDKCSYMCAIDAQLLKCLGH